MRTNRPKTFIHTVYRYQYQYRYNVEVNCLVRMWYRTCKCVGAGLCPFHVVLTTKHSRRRRSSDVEVDVDVDVDVSSL